MKASENPVTARAELWNWQQLHVRPIPRGWRGSPLFRVVPGGTPAIMFVDFYLRGRRFSRSIAVPELVSAVDWRAALARRLRYFRLEMRVPPYTPEETANVPSFGEHRTDALRYGLQLYTTGRGAGGPMIPPRPVPFSRGARGWGPGFAAADALLGNAPTIADGLMDLARRRMADFLAHHTDEGIRAGLIALGWTPPPPPGTVRTGPSWVCDLCGQRNSSWASECGRCERAR